MLWTFEYQPCSLASAISPLSALAAAVSGDERYIRPPVPILPLKLRLEVERQVSPSQITPIWAPRHGPHPGGATITPAFKSSEMIPDSVALISIEREAGRTIVLTLTFLPLRIFATASRSSYLPFVHEPMNTWSRKDPVTSPPS